MALLEIQNEIEQTATAGRFFIEENYSGLSYPETARAMYDHGETFWLKHCLELPNEPATILLAGLNDKCLVDTRDPHDRVVTLVFDSSKRPSGKYIWELICAEINGPREVLRLDVTPWDLHAKNSEFDNQGILRRVSPIDPNQVARAICSLAYSKQLAKKVADHEKKREKFEEELAVAAVIGISRYSEHLHQKKIKDIEARISKIGFNPTALQT